MEQTYYQEVSAERDVSGSNFSKGEINYLWNFDSKGYFNPYRSYMRVRFSLKKDDTTNLIKTDDIAPSKYFFDNLFQQQKICLNNKCISEINDYCPQISALKHRMYKSEDYKTSVGLSQNFTSGDIELRQDTFGIGTTAAQSVNEYEVVARPALSFFDIDGFVPSGQSQWCLTLTPQTGTNFSKFAIESQNADKTPDSDYKFEILSMNLYLFKGIGPVMVDKTFAFNMKEIMLQTQNITTSSLTQKTFSVNPKTTELTLAFQRTGAGYVDTRFPATQFTCLSNDELNLIRFYITYNGKQLPVPIPDLEKTQNKNFMNSRYNETLMYSGGINGKLEYESLQDWLDRGPYYHFSGYSPTLLMHDRVYVSHQFSGFNGGQSPDVLLFNHYIKSVVINIKGGRLVNVEVN